MQLPKYSIVVPVFNRPNEVAELLESLTLQSYKSFEVIIVEDGSTLPCEDIVRQYADRLNIRYIIKSNSGPGPSRNVGAKDALGSYIIFLDSDCIAPPAYLANIEAELQDNPADAFGGPDAAHHSFTPTQKAINYSMTSFLTTGGIRGGMKKLDIFYPRSFNMGISKEVLRHTNGFAPMRFGEDVDLSLRIVGMGFTTRLLQSAFVYHKRRANLRQFYKQVFNSGIARINLHLLHPGSLKIVHLLPTLFVLGMICFAILPLICVYSLLAPLGYCLLVFSHSLGVNRNIKVAILSIPAAWVQLFGYGLGFLAAVWNILVLRKQSYQAFNKNFYK